MSAVQEEESYLIRNMLAVTISNIAKVEFPEVWDYMEDICDCLLEEEDLVRVDGALRVLINLLHNAGDEFHQLIPKIFENLFSVFANSNAGPSIREKCLEVYHLGLRCCSWADGIEE